MQKYSVNQYLIETLLTWLKSGEIAILPRTAYQVIRSHQKRKLQKEYEKYWKTKGEVG